jgi:ring-1,2-phenylacetyl-CoA epoxidase subunit PaaE
MSTKFYALPVASINRETATCVSIGFQIPEDLKSTFTFTPGQYLTIKTIINGEEIRRSYSICSAPLESQIRVAVKQVEHGKFSTYALQELKVGDVLELMPPMGNFVSKSTSPAKHTLLIAAGSGITPMMSMIKTGLTSNDQDRFTLLYGNQTRQSIIFREELEDLKNKYVSRLSLNHVLSREALDLPIMHGRIDAQKCTEFSKGIFDCTQITEAFICGPEAMILEVKNTLLALGMDNSNIHIELFTTASQQKTTSATQKESTSTAASEVSKVKVRIDGVTLEMDVPYEGDTILDVALQQGADLPYACKGGVCCTCKAKVLEGSVSMEVNYALESDEIKKGFVLSCQAHPTSAEVFLDFDAR